MVLRTRLGAAEGEGRGLAGFGRRASVAAVVAVGKSGFDLGHVVSVEGR